MNGPGPQHGSAPLGCAEAQESFGVLVLGAIDPMERERVEAHVFSCGQCPQVLAGLSALPGLLRRLEVERPEPIRPPQALLDRVVAQVRAEQSAARRAPRRRAAVLALAGLAVAAVVVAVAVLALPRGGDSAVVATPTSVSATDPGSRVAASVTLVATPEGTQLRLEVNGVDPGARCEIVVVGRDGSSEVAASWMAGYVGSAEVTGTTSIPAAQIARIDVTSPGLGTLVSLPVAG